MFQTTGATLTRVETDGRDFAGVKQCGAGIGLNNADNTTLNQCYAHHNGYSHGFAFYRSRVIRTYGCGAEYNGQTNGSGTATAGTKGDGFNHEQTFDTIHQSPYSGFNSLSEFRYYGNADTATYPSAYGGDTYPHEVHDLTITDGGPWDVRIDNLQSTLPVLSNCPTPVYAYT